jgi:hypothetical protein
MFRRIRTALSRRPVAVLAVALGALAIVPAAASAKLTYVGSSLNHSPANAGSTCEEDGILGALTCTHVGSFYPGTSGREKAPVSGTIVRFKVRAEGPTTMTFKTVKLRRVSQDHKSGKARAMARGRTVDVQGPTQDQLDNGISPVETFKAHLPVRKGQSIAIDTNSNTAEYCADGTPGQLLFDPVLSRGTGFHKSDSVDGCLMLVKAVIRPSRH